MHLRQTWRGFAAICAIALFTTTMGANAADKRFDGVTLRVATWGGSWRDRLNELVASDLEKRGAKVELIVGSPREQMAKLIAARGKAEAPFDLIEISDNSRREMFGSGFLTDLDYTNIPNAKEMPAEFRLKNLVSIWASQDGIVYNEEKLKAAGIEPPKTFADLLNPKLKGWVSFPDISVVHGIKALVAAAYETGGDETKIDDALSLVKKIEPQFYWKSSVDLLAKFKAGDIWVAPWHVGWAVRGRDAGIPLNITWPKIKDQMGTVAVTWIGVVAGTKHKAAAEYFINRYLDMEPQLEMGKANGVVPQNAAAANKFAEDPKLLEIMLLKPQDRAKLYYPDFGSIDVRTYTDKWNRQVLR